MSDQEAEAIDAIARQIGDSIIATRRSARTHVSDVERIPQPEMFGKPLAEIDELARMLVAAIEDASSESLNVGYHRTAERRHDIFCAGRRLAYSAWKLKKPDL